NRFHALIVIVYGLRPLARIRATRIGSGNLEIMAVPAMTRLAKLGLVPLTSKYILGSLAKGLHEYNLPAQRTILHRLSQSSKCPLRADFTALLFGFSPVIA